MSPKASSYGETATAETILRVATELFHRRGYQGTSMRDIARLVKIKPPSLYNHYSSKEELLWQIVITTTRDIDAAQRRALSVAEGAAAKLVSFVDQHVRYNAEKKESAIIANVQIYNLEPHHFAEISQLRQSYEQMIYDILEEGKLDGTFADHDTAIVAHAILQMGAGVSQWYRPSGRLTIDELCRMYQGFALAIARAEIPAPPAAHSAASAPGP